MTSPAELYRSWIVSLAAELFTQTGDAACSLTRLGVVYGNVELRASIGEGSNRLTVIRIVNVDELAGTYNPEEYAKEVVADLVRRLSARVK